MSAQRMFKRAFFASTLVASMSAAVEAKTEPVAPLDMLVFHANVAGSPEEVWQAWSTVEGLETFFGPKVIFEPHPMGEFAIHWAPENPPGSRGAEDLHIMAFEPNHRRLAFTWSAPPQWPEIRAQRAMAEIRVRANGEGGSLVSLYHYGWGEGEDWMAVRDYFASAWKIILARLQYRFETGPVNWQDVPRDIEFVPADQ